MIRLTALCRFAQLKIGSHCHLAGWAVHLSELKSPEASAAVQQSSLWTVMLLSTGSSLQSTTIVNMKTASLTFTRLPLMFVHYQRSARKDSASSPLALPAATHFKGCL